MTRIIIHGALGKMGHKIAELAQQDPEFTIVAGIDAAAGSNSADAPFPIYANWQQCTQDADVVIDFSTAAAADALLDACAERKLNLVLCTTGLSDAQLEHMREASGKTAILRSANMSVGINLLMALLKKVSAQLSGAGYDIEITERHHNRKIDAPSGTAIALGEAVNAGLEEPLAFVFDRSAKREARSKKEIGFSAVRGGTIVGEHEVIFAGEDEVITFSHTAYSRAIFGKGALEAARFLAGKAPGMYSMEDVMDIG
ncbi:MAG: 4-hydroxy-tetrahydrodipicolinate reductase [Lachnospiraceae bacterium]|nr:4-hydroxy-tetrahydrodipicolinate reductase [Lachnospiraceae bacterium]